jgi:hypothetical protein
MGTTRRIGFHGGAGLIGITAGRRLRPPRRHQWNSGQPGGRRRIAQRFIAGSGRTGGGESRRDDRSHALLPSAPGGSSFVPTGLWYGLLEAPAMNRRAIFGHSCGTFARRPPPRAWPWDSRGLRCLAPKTARNRFQGKFVFIRAHPWLNFRFSCVSHCPPLTSARFRVTKAQTHSDGKRWKPEDGGQISEETATSPRPSPHLSERRGRTDLVSGWKFSAA